MISLQPVLCNRCYEKMRESNLLLRMRLLLGFLGQYLGYCSLGHSKDACNMIYIISDYSLALM
jgi:hypothetical protein